MDEDIEIFWIMHRMIVAIATDGLMAPTIEQKDRSLEAILVSMVEIYKLMG